MAHTIHCDIVSAEEQIYSGTVKMVYASGEMGELGIAPRHAPLLTRLKPGELRVELEDGSEELFFVSGGLIEVQPHMVTVLSDTAIRADDLDEAAAIKAREDAEQALKDKTGDLEIAEAQARLTEAVAQLAAVSKLKKMAKRSR